MQFRNRTLEQLMRSVLETQAAMLAAMTQMQQALLSGMIMRKPEETGAEPEKGELEGVANQTDQQASKPQTRSKPEHPPYESKPAPNGSEDDQLTPGAAGAPGDVSTVLVREARREPPPVGARRQPPPRPVRSGPEPERGGSGRWA